MLRHLSIRSFALVDEIELDFANGLTVFVGETGAGKSIIIDAIAAALGDRLSADVLRQGARKAVVEATFDVSGLPHAKQFITEHELDWDSAELVVRRELTAGGSSRCFVNDNPTSAGVVRELSAYLIDFHGQHDTHGLLNPKRHYSLLDAVSSTDLLMLSMSEHWHSLVVARKELSELVERSKRADEERARLSFICNEIKQIDPVPGEDQQIVQDLRRAESSESIIVNAAAAREALYAMEASAYDLIQQSKERLRSLLQYDQSLEQSIQDLDSAATACKEIAAAIAPLADPEDFSAERLEELRQRLAALNRLIRKYGTLAESIDTYTQSQKALDQLDHMEGALDTCKKAVSEAEDEAMKVAKKISAARKKAAPSLSKSVTTSLSHMGMPSAQFVVSCTPAELGPTGADNIEFMFSGNAGEPTYELSRIASGGELSRVMLALKQAMSAHGGIGTLVFDEIDTGVSGRIARSVGDVMKQLSDRHQILCITHLPQIASLAHQMIKVEKSEKDNITSISAASVHGNDMVVEVARLLSTSAVTEAALLSAREMMSVTTPHGNS